MIITEKDLETQYAHWFRNVKHPEEAKKELLANLGQEPEPYTWTEQDLSEQARKILAKWSRI